MLVEGYTTIIDSGGAGKHRGGNGVEKIFYFLEEGDISIHDDRHDTQPWGILGGRPAACSEKWLVRKDGSREPLPSKIDNVRVRNGDRVIFRTAGGGGWGDPLERDPMRTRNDVARKLMTETKAREDYGVVLTGPASTSIAGPPTSCATACGGIGKLRSCSISESAGQMLRPAPFKWFERLRHMTTLERHEMGRVRYA